ncbi:MAG TPA: hypothetical protein PKO38_04240 [Bacillota bacterium]|nr:hypothetical protein [Bacillota bacterium]HOB86881.1 hypothetical protein [Bacillota bacterium]HOP69760.1 hypothetical protein [Bacillota bacterium]HPT34675.1 hypothetical protein [Bacillota bacterium]HPZ64380.1 hypothetical protein [Bacillota bacterium]
MKRFALLGFLLAWAGLILLAGGCLSHGRGEQSSPQKTVEAYLQAFQEKDCDRMLQLSRAARIEPEEMKLIKIMEIKDYRVGPVKKISSQEVEVEVSLDMVLFGVETVHTDRLRLVKEGGRWYLKQKPLEDK